MFPFLTGLRERFFDERFALHRYKSTSRGGVSVAVLMGLWSLYDLFVHSRLRMDFLILLGIMAVVKLGFMARYRTHD